MCSRQTICPSRVCPEQDPVQTLIDQKLADLANEPALVGATRCATCGCVWVLDQSGNRRELGTLRKVGGRFQWQARKI